MPADRYVFVTIGSKEENFEKLVGVLSNFPILGIEEVNDTLVVTFKQNEWEKIEYDFFCESLKIADPIANVIQIETIEEKNWNEEFERNLTPIVITERIAVVPSKYIGSTGKPIELVVDPKMSFGTGHHSTTRIMIRLAEKYVKENSFWIDVGTGTGILAILAKKLGAKEVLAIDNNSWSIQNAFENIKNNKIAEGIDLIEMDVDILPNLPLADGIFANLNYDLIVRNLRKFLSSVETMNGKVLVSGILIYDFDDFENHCRKNYFEIVEVLKEDEWFGAVLIPEKTNESSGH